MTDTQTIRPDLNRFMATRMGATTSTPAVRAGLAAAIANTSANGRSATASPSVTGVGGSGWIVSSAPTTESPVERLEGLRIL
jgi:hypothetical protein